MTQPSQGNIRTPDVELKIGDKTYTLRFSTRATMDLMDLWNLKDQRDLQAAMQDRGKTIGGMIEVVWAALRTHHRDLTVDNVIDLLDAEDLGDVMERVGEAISRAIPEAPKAEGQ